MFISILNVSAIIFKIQFFFTDTTLIQNKLGIDNTEYILQLLKHQKYH